MTPIRIAVYAASLLQLLVMAALVLNNGNALSATESLLALLLFGAPALSLWFTTFGDGGGVARHWFERRSVEEQIRLAKARRELEELNKHKE